MLMNGQWSVASHLNICKQVGFLCILIPSLESWFCVCLKKKLETGGNCWKQKPITKSVKKKNIRKQPLYFVYRFYL